MVLPTTYDPDPADDIEAEAPETPDESLEEVPEPEADEADEGAAEPEADDEDAEEPEEGDRRKLVPHYALHRERERLKAVKEEARVTREALANERKAREDLETMMLDMRAMMQRMASITQAPPPPAAKPVEEPLPDFNLDPMGHINAKLERAMAMVQQVTAPPPPADSGDADLKLPPPLARDLDACQAAARKVHPDYDSVIVDYLQRRVAEQVALGYDPHQAAQVVDREVIARCKDLMARGQNPAHAYYRLAKAPPTSAAAQAPAPARPTPPVPPSKVPAQQAAAKAAQTLSKAGKRPNDTPTVDALLKRKDKMSDREFAAAFKKIFGG